MSTEYELYAQNVPQGDDLKGFGDWSSSQDEVSVTVSTGKKGYISTIGFIIDDAATITAGKIELKNDTTVVEDFDNSNGDDFTKFFALADPFSLKVLKFDGTNDAVVGEIRFNPPEEVTATKKFTITPTGLTITAGGIGPFFTIKGWEVSV
jgi:hypothetical protein